MYEHAGTPGLAHLLVAAAISGSLAQIRLGSRQGDSTGPAARSTAGHAEGSDARPGKLSQYTLTAIESEASTAAKGGLKPVEACSYPFSSPEGWHWMACYLLAGGAL